MVLAACHSLVQVDAAAPAAPPPQRPGQPPAIAADASGAKPQLIGDPVELAALQGISWEYVRACVRACVCARVRCYCDCDYLYY